MKWVVRILGMLLYVASVLVVWAVLGSAHKGPVPGGLLALRMTWPLLVGLALPLVLFMAKAWRDE